VDDFKGGEGYTAYVVAEFPIGHERSDTGIDKKTSQNKQHTEILATSEVQQTETTTQSVK